MARLKGITFSCGIKFICLYGSNMAIIVWHDGSWQRVEHGTAEKRFENDDSDPRMKSREYWVEGGWEQVIELQQA